MASLNDKRFVPHLIDALSHKNQSALGAVISALTGQLTGLKPSDASLLTTEHRTALHHLMAGGISDFPLRIAILRALEQVGDERDVPAIRRVAEMEAATRAEINLRQAARDCLPFVEQRVASNRAADTLLRAATTGSESALLRPIDAISDDDPGSLLRPSNDWEANTDTAAGSEATDRLSHP